VLLRESLDEPPPTAVGVAVELWMPPPQRLDRRREGSELALVGGELDHPLEAEFALYLLDGLPRLVGDELRERRPGQVTSHAETLTCCPMDEIGLVPSNLCSRARLKSFYTVLIHYLRSEAIRSRREVVQKGTVRPLKLTSGDTSWRVQYRDSTGRQVLETLGRESEGWTKKKAEAELAERISRVANKNWTKPKPLTFSEYADHWFERGLAQDKWDQSSLRSYRRAIQVLKDHFGPIRLTDIRRPAVSAFFAGLSLPGATTTGEGYSPRTVSRFHSVFHAIMERAVVEELIDRNPAKGVELPKPKAYRPVVLTPEQALEVESKINDPQVLFAFRVFKLLGLRWCELQQLRWRDLDFLNSRLRIVESKTEEGERVLAVPWDLLKEFQAHADRSHYTHPDDYLFHHPTRGTKWNVRYYHDGVRAAAEAVGITEKFRPAHDLRVTSITSGVLAGEHPDKLQARAGHRNYKTTQGYIKLAGVVFQEEADALAAFFAGKTR
jgi:integrase